MKFKSHAILLVLLLVADCLFSQTDTVKTKFRPTFLGGEKAYSKFIQDHLIFPEKERDEFRRGHVLVSFLVDSVNKVSEIKVVHSVCPALDREAVRVVSLTKDKWTAALLNGVPVSKRDTLTVGFLTSVYMGKGKQSWYTSDNFNYNKGVEASGKKDFKNALLYFDDAMDYHNSDIDILYNRGICKLQLGDKVGACTDWKRIKELGKPDADELLTKYCK